MIKLKDIAEAANVSPITVSRVLNEPELVNPETKRHIEKIMKDMGYTPNIAARNLVAKRDGIMDVYIPEHIDLSNPFVMNFVIGISEVLSEELYSFLIRRSYNKEHRCDGYIVTGLLTDEIHDFYQYAKARERPIALFGHADIEDIDCVDVDNVLGGTMAARHLIQQGHTKIGMINVDEDKDYTGERYQGYVNAMQEAGNVIDPGLIIRGANSVNGGYAAAKTLLKTGGWTALFCATDTLAIGAINAINEADLSVPADISIVGFDGLGHHLLAEPHITTIRQPIIEIGRRLAHVLLDRVNGKKNRVAEMIAPVLVPGKTVRALV